MANTSKDEFRDAGMGQNDAVLADAKHYLLPPEFAPAKFQHGIANFLSGHPFDRNVFCISRFARHGEDPVADSIEVCRSVCSELGLELHLASDRTVEEMLFGNIAAAMWASHYGIAIFEDRVGEGLNNNVALEVGVMLATGRRCLLLKDTTIERLPTDLVGHVYQNIDLADPSSVDSAVRRWIAQDLGLKN